VPGARGCLLPGSKTTIPSRLRDRTLGPGSGPLTTNRNPRTAPEEDNGYLACLLRTGLGEMRSLVNRHGLVAMERPRPGKRPALAPGPPAGKTGRPTSYLLAWDGTADEPQLGVLRAGVLGRQAIVPVSCHDTEPTTGSCSEWHARDQVGSRYRVLGSSLPICATPSEPSPGGQRSHREARGGWQLLCDSPRLGSLRESSSGYGSDYEKALSSGYVHTA
jgi:hypothetical protein